MGEDGGARPGAIGEEGGAPSIDGGLSSSCGRGLIPKARLGMDGKTDLPVVISGLAGGGFPVTGNGSECFCVPRRGSGNGELDC